MVLIDDSDEEEPVKAKPQSQAVRSSPRKAQKSVLPPPVEAAADKEVKHTPQKEQPPMAAQKAPLAAKV